MLTIDLRLPNVTAFSTERGPEVKPGAPYSGFNACHYTGDSATHVAESRASLCRKLGIEPDHVIIPRQTHSDRAVIIDTLPVAAKDLEGVDALVTTLPSVALCINTADCVPVLLVDPMARVIAAAHCGWRGTVNRLLDNTVELMCSLGAHRSDIRAAMGPSICADCFEVGNEVAEKFEAEFPGNASIIDRSYAKPHIDLAQAIATRLSALGIGRDRISAPPVCSRCNPDRFFSPGP